MRFSGDNYSETVNKLAEIAALRQRIQPVVLQNPLTPGERTSGLDHLAMDAAQSPGLHDVRPLTYRDGPAAMGFLCGLTAMAAARRTGAVIWIAQARGGLDFGLPYGPGLKRIGIDPRRVLLIDAPDDVAALWAAEEAAKAGGTAAILAQTLGPIDLTAARRVHLAAARGGVFAGFAQPHRALGLAPALTRWTVNGACGAARNLTQWATPRWRAGIDRRRNGPPAPAQILEWDHAAHRMRLGAVLGVQGPDVRGQAPDLRSQSPEWGSFADRRRAG
jgi:protein ImuA